MNDGGDGGQPLLRSGAYQTRKWQNELLVVSGSNYTSHINIIRKGISIKDHISIDDLPAIQQEGGLNSVGDKLFIRVFGISQMIVAKL